MIWRRFRETGLRTDLSPTQSRPPVQMTFETTLIALFAFLGLTVFCGWRGARNPDPKKGPRLIPWRLIMVLAAAAMFVLIVHLAGLAGVVPVQGPVR